MMRWEKEAREGEDRTVAEDWAWGFPTYELEIDAAKDIATIEIDSSKMMADVNPSDNVWNKDGESSEEEGEE